MEPLNREGRSLPPRSAWLTAYVDGELGPAEQLRVEAWLAEDAAARAEVEEQCRLRDLFVEDAEVGTAEPSERRWTRTLGAISQRVEMARRERAVPPSRWLSKAIFWTTAAATVVFAVWVGTHALPRGEDPNRDRQALDNNEREYAVVGEGDVTIDDMNWEELDALVRGRTARRPAFVLLAEEEVEIHDMDPADARLLVRGKPPSIFSEELLTRNALEVASAEEVFVETMDGNDAGGLVVCDPPVVGRLALARAGDIRIDFMQGLSADDPKPIFHEPRGGMPILMAPLKGARVGRD